MCGVPAYSSPPSSSSSSTSFSSNSTVSSSSSLSSSSLAYSPVPARLSSPAQPSSPSLAASLSLSSLSKGIYKTQLAMSSIDKGYNTLGSVPSVLHDEILPSLKKPMSRLSLQTVGGPNTPQTSFPRKESNLLIRARSLGALARRISICNSRDTIPDLEKSESNQHSSYTNGSDYVLSADLILPSVSTSLLSVRKKGFRKDQLKSALKGKNLSIRLKNAMSLNKKCN
ncbi:hypothetical protein F4703DRAFT_1821839, partial [Phycomyces blakesleeanus]